MQCVTLMSLRNVSARYDCGCEMMNIAYVIAFKIPARAANNIHVMKMCSALVNAGAQVTLVAPQSSDIEPGIDNIYKHYGVPENFTIKKIPVRFKHIQKIGNFLCNFQIAKFAAKNNFDCIFCRNLFICFFLAVFFRKPFIYEHHAAFRPNSISDLFFRTFCKSKYLKRFIVVTEALRQHYMSQYGLDEKLFYIAPDGADALPESVAPAELNVKSQGMFHVGYIGHLYKGRGIELIGSMAVACPFAFFHIIGGTEDDIAYWRAEYKDINNIHFYGYIPHFQTVSYGVCMDALIAPYQSVVHIASSAKNGDNTANWMSPLKIFEYMALGKPIICSDMPVLREVLTNRVNGIMCPPEDARAWSEAIKKLYDSKELATALGAKALTEFNRYTWNARAKNIMKDVIVEMVEE